MPPAPSITTNGTDFSVGDTLSVTITIPKSNVTNGTLYIGQTQIPIQESVSPYTYNYILTTSGNYNVYFVTDVLAYSDTINISVTGSPSSSSVFLTTITKVKTALENVFVKKSDIKDNLTSTDTDKPLSANQGKELKTLVDGKANSNHNHTGYASTGHNHGSINNDGTFGTDGYLETEDGRPIFHIETDENETQSIYFAEGKIVDEIDGLVYYTPNYEEIEPTMEIATIGDIPSITGKEDKSNKSSSITTDTGSTTKYPTVKAVEDYAQPIGNYLTSHQDLSNYVQKSQTNGLIKNDGTIDTNTYSQTNHTHSSLTGIEIPLGADLNDYTTEGYYYHSPGQYSNVLHTPVTMLTGFKLIVSTRTHPNGTIIKNQIFINEVTNTIYIRDSHTKTEYWSDWYHFYTPNTNPIVSSFSIQLSDNNIPSEKLVKNSLDTKQDTLVSGTNIKSINGSSLIGSGNLTINPTLNGYCEDGTSGCNIFDDTNGNQMFFMDYKLAFDFDTGKIYYDPLNLYNYSSNTEIATIGDIPNISGKANSSDFDTLTATVNYTDNTSETVTFYIVPSNNNG